MAAALCAVLFSCHAAVGGKVPAPTLTSSSSGPARQGEHPLVRPVCGSLASCTAEVATLPIDVTKVRMQLATDSSTGFIATMRDIVDNDGAGALFRGVKPALLRQASYQGVKMFLYEPLRDAVLKATTPPGEEGSKPKLWQMIVAGGLAGAIGTFITSPTDLVKIRMQSGVQFDGVFAAFAQIAMASGIFSLWDGWQPNVQRSFIVNAAELASYDYFKQKLLDTQMFEEGLIVHTLASMMAGLIAALASTPVDRAKTLLMTDREKYGSVFSCLFEIARTRGLAGLYQGFLATWMRLGPWALLFFVCFEQFRNMAAAIEDLVAQRTPSKVA